MVRHCALPLQISHGQTETLNRSQLLRMGQKHGLKLSKMPRSDTEPYPSNIVHPTLKKFQHIGRRRFACVVCPTQWVNRP
jgi:hypothetical protein